MTYLLILHTSAACEQMRVQYVHDRRAVAARCDSAQTASRLLRRSSGASMRQAPKGSGRIFAALLSQERSDMTNDELRALAKALEHMDLAPCKEAAAYLRACADAEPVGYVTANGLRSLRQDDATVLLYAHDYLILGGQHD